MFLIGEPVRKVLAAICHVPRPEIIYQELSEESDPSGHLQPYSPPGNGHRKQLFCKCSTVVLRVDVPVQLSAEGWRRSLPVQLGEANRMQWAWKRSCLISLLKGTSCFLMVFKSTSKIVYYAAGLECLFFSFFFLREFKCRRTQNIVAIECFITI